MNQVGDDAPGADQPENVERFEYHGLVVERNGADIRFWREDGADANDLRDQFIRRGQAAAEVVRTIGEELKALLTEVNPIHLVGQVAAWTTVGAPDTDDADVRFGLQAQVEYLVGLALTIETPLTREPAGPFHVQGAIGLLADLFEAEKARILGEEAAGAGPPDALAQARFILRLEGLLDRTQGYVPHLEQTVRGVFEPIRGECENAIGFCPADVPDLVAAIISNRQEKFEIRMGLAEEVDPEELPGESPEEQGWALMSWVMFGLVDWSGDFTPADLAEVMGVETDHVVAMLEAFAAGWGCQPNFHSPSEPNVARSYPVLFADPGRYSVPLVWSLIHETIPWFKDFVENEGLDGLREAYLRERGPAVENLTMQALTEVLGAERVLTNLEYPIGSGNWAEVDGLVILDGHVIVVEAKSNALHDAYRRGDSERIGYHIEDLINVPMQQSARAAKYLIDGGTRFRRGEDQDEVVVPPTTSVTRIVVSLERIDPLVLISADLATGGEEAEIPAWVVAIPDLLAVCEILHKPHLIIPYVLLRARFGQFTDVKVITEMDFLGAFLNDRLRRFADLVIRAEPPQINALARHSHDLNIYFTALTAGIESEKPGIEIDHGDEERLTASYFEHSTTWVADACAVVLGDHPIDVA